MTMTTTHATALVPLDRLIVSSLNVRKHANKHVASLAHAIATTGLLQSLVVRPAADGTFEVMAGQRRLRALQALAKSGTGMAFPIDPVSCLVVAGADDADAIALSLTENIERAPMDELDEYQAFCALLKAGRSEEQVAAEFGVPLATVRKRLAIARLIPPVQRAYRDGRIDASTLQTLTLATRKQQAEYLALLNDPSKNAPPHYKLRAWILGGEEISIDVALFPLEDYSGAIKTDLFAEQAYFADSEKFWQHQTQAVEALRSRTVEAGWANVKVIGPHERFEHWQYLAVSKRKGGHYVIELRADGRVEQHKGMLPRAQALRATAQGGADQIGNAAVDTETSEPPASGRPELSGPLSNYIDTVRLVAVRTALLTKPEIALRLLLAQLIGGAQHLTAKAEPMTPATGDIAGALQELPARSVFDTARTAALEALGYDGTDQTLVQRPTSRNAETPRIFAKLLECDAAQVNGILAVLAAETLAIGTSLVDEAGSTLNTAVASTWAPDDAFFGLIRDRAVSIALLAEIAPESPRPALSATAKETRARIRTALARRPAANPWTPKWMSFPASAYSDRPLTSRPRQGA